VHTIIIFLTAIEGETTVTLASNPAGIRVSGAANTFDYPILSSVTLMCIVYPTPSDPVTYQWNTEGCYVNNVNESRCFPAGQTTQSVSEDDLIAIDAGTITCTTTILGVEYTSNEFTLRISGMWTCSYTIIHHKVAVVYIIAPRQEIALFSMLRITYRSCDH